MNFIKKLTPSYLVWVFFASLLLLSSTLFGQDASSEPFQNTLWDQFFISLSFFFGVFHIVLFLVNTKDKLPLWFGLGCMGIMGMNLFQGDILSIWLGIPIPEWFQDGGKNYAALWGAFFILTYLSKIPKIKTLDIILKVYLAACVCFSFWYLLPIPYYLTVEQGSVFVVMASVFLGIFYTILKGEKEQRVRALVILFCLAIGLCSQVLSVYLASIDSWISNTFWGKLSQQSSLVLLFISQAIILTLRFRKTLILIEEGKIEAEEGKKKPKLKTKTF